MPTNYGRAAVLLLGGGLLLAATACGTQVAGSPRALSSSPDVSALRVQTVASVNLRKKFNESPQSVNEYWTAERLRNAKPRDPGRPGPNPTTPPTTAPPTTAPPTPAPRTTPRPAPRSTVKRTTAKPAPRSTVKRTTPKPAPRSTVKRTTPKPAPRTTTRPAPRTTTQPAPRTTTTPAPRTTTRPAPRTTPPASPPPVQDPGVNRIIAPTRGSPRPVTLSNSSSGARFGKVGLAKSTAGRLYYVFGKQNYVCSATVVHSSSGSVVATAGHCVWDTSGGGWGHNYVFIPSDANNGASQPYGRWVAQKIYTTKAFVQGAHENSRSTYGPGWAYDSAFLQMARANGRTIQSVTGGQGVAFGSPVRSLMVIGYPTAPPFDGRSERFCSSSGWAQGVYGDRTINCVMTPGCSGGGWLSSYNPASGAGYLVGMTSVTDGRHLSSAVMGGAAANVYDLANGAG